MSRLKVRIFGALAPGLIQFLAGAGILLMALAAEALPAAAQSFQTRLPRDSPRR